jgi:hypothetical protein
MIQLKLKIVVTLPAGWMLEGRGLETPQDRRIWSMEVNEYDVDYLNSWIPTALDAAKKALGLNEIGDLKPFAPEIGVYLSADKGDCRPAIHLTAQAITFMNEAGAEFDFDPYVEF